MNICKEYSLSFDSDIQTMIRNMLPNSSTKIHVV